MKSPEFTRSSKQDWKAQAAKDLKTDDLDNLLKWEPLAGIQMDAYYDIEDRKSHKQLSSFFSNLPLKHWELMQWVDVKDYKTANQMGLHGLNNGATGVLFHIDKWHPEMAESLFKNIQSEYCTVSFDGKEADMAADWFLKTQDNGANVNGFVVNGRKMINQYETFKTLGLLINISGDRISSLATYLKNLDQFYKIYGEDFLSHLCVSLVLSEKFYQDISTIRAIRWLTYLWTQSNELENRIEGPYIHVNPPIGSDYKNSMLVNTTAGIAGVLGGANSIHFQLESDKSGDFNDRIARNVGNLLRDEAQLVFDKDPVAGSYFLDSLTDRLSEASWNLYTASL